MATTYAHILALAREAVPPADGILSRTVHQDDRAKAVVFGQDRELSEHPSAMPAMMDFVEGEAEVGLGDESQAARAGTRIHVPAHLKHAIRARAPAVMRPVLLK